MIPEFLATTNMNKLKEINSILGYELKQISIELYEPQEIKIEKVIEEKAKDAFYKTNKIVLVEDTALEFLVWNGLPGALIKSFLKSIGNEGILKMLKDEQNRKAIAKTAIGFFDGNKSYIFIGEIKGNISLNIKGENGFSWDSIFIPEWHSKTFAEMSFEEKNSFSMRKIAIEKMKKELKI